MHQILYVQPRTPDKQPDLIYIRYKPDGKVDIATDSPPKPLLSCPWIRVAARELKRQRHLLGIVKAVGRPPLPEDERKARLAKSSQDYRARIEQQRQELGVPLERVPLGSSAPQEDVERVLELCAQVNPETGKAYSNVEIALLLGRSPSFVSRVKNGRRRNKQKAS